LETEQWSLAADALHQTPIVYLLMVGKDEESMVADEVEVKNDGNQYRPRTTDRDRLAILVEISSKHRTWQDGKGRTFLHHAIEATDDETVKTIARNVDTNVADKRGQTSLHYALMHNRNNIAVHLINDCNANASSKTENGRTPLMLASERNFEDVVTAILDSGNIGMNVQDSEGRTALHYAMGIRTPGQTPLEMFIWLEKAGCDIAFVNSKGRTILHDSLKGNVEPIWKYLLWDRNDSWKANSAVIASPSVLIEAITGGCGGEAVQKILQSWPDLINKTDSPFSKPAVSFAIESNQLDVVNILVAVKEADLNLVEYGSSRAPL
jgi:hypothetical protein